MSGPVHGSPDAIDQPAHSGSRAIALGKAVLVTLLSGGVLFLGLGLGWLIALTVADGWPLWLAEGLWLATCLMCIGAIRETVYSSGQPRTGAVRAAWLLVLVGLLLTIALVWLGPVRHGGGAGLIGGLERPLLALCIT